MQRQRILYDKCQDKFLNHQYRIGQMISNGSYGCVYYAEDNLGKPKAIKIIDLSRINKNVQNSLEKEVQIMKQCEGKFSVECEGSKNDNENNIKFIVMELCSQRSLQDLVWQKGHLGQIQAKVYIKNILCGIINMHHLKFSHRDVKSSNICIRNDRCILIDFGCSREFDGNEKGQMITNIGTIINKSPEILQEKPYTYKTDYWAVGILYYQLLTGITPFNLRDKQTNKEMLDEILQHVNSIYSEEYIKTRIKKYYPTFKHRVNYKISEKAKNFLSRLITFKPEDRSDEYELKNCKYLKQFEVGDIWEISKCFLPLKNDKWEQIIPKIEQRQNLEKSALKEEFEIQMEILEEEKSRQCEEITTLSDVCQEEKTSLNKKFQQWINRDKNKIGNLRKYDFEVKRIKLLFELKQYLKNIVPPILHLKQFINSLNYYCLEKMQKVNMAAFKQNMGIYSEGLNPIIKNNFLNTYLCNEFMNDQQKYGAAQYTRLVDICETISKELQYQKLPKDLEIFWAKYKKILEYEYQPSKQKYIWWPWNSFGLVLKYIQENPKLQQNS